MSDDLASSIPNPGDPSSHETLSRIYGNRALRSLRRIIRAVDIHSRKLNTEYSVTTPQMICLCALAEEGAMTLTALSRQVDLSVSTVNGIVDRLESKEMVFRQRSGEDRRKVFVDLTPAGLGLCDSAPALLQDSFSRALGRLPDQEQATITLALERVVELMAADDLEAAPHLIPSAQVNAVRDEGSDGLLKRPDIPPNEDA